MKDTEAIQRKLEALVKVENERVEAAQQAVHLGRWGMGTATVGLLLALGALQREDTGLWIRVLGLGFSGLCGYAFGRVEKCLGKRAQPRNDHWTAFFR